MAGAPAAPGVYAVYDSAGVLQYIGLSRKVLRQEGCCIPQAFADTALVLESKATL